jgi:hypothetical protein
MIKEGDLPFSTLEINHTLRTIEQMACADRGTNTINDKGFHRRHIRSTQRIVLR